jgi:hypothetical protein
MKVLPTASGRLVFHSFMQDPDTHCERISSATVSSVMCVVFPLPLTNVV